MNASAVTFTAMPGSLTLEGSAVSLPVDTACKISPALTAYVKTENAGAYWALHTLTLENPSQENSGRITLPRVLDTLIPAKTPVLYHSIEGDSCSKDSFMPINQVLSPGDTLTLTPRGGRSSNATAFPIFDITADGVAYLIAVGWSGQWKAELSFDADGLRVTVGMEHADFYMKPGETFSLPSCLIVTAATPEEARRRFRQLMVTTFSPIPKDYPNDHLPISIQTFDRYFWSGRDAWATEEGQHKVLDGMLKCKHMDTLWLDAAWFTKGFPDGVGNFSMSEGFPRGLKPVSDEAHKNGVQFLLWFEPERVARGTEVFREHPDFYLCGHDHPDDENTFLYNLADPIAWQWLYGTLSSIIRENGIDIYRQDFNMDPLGYWIFNSEEGRLGVLEIRYIDGLYRLWDGLRAEFPHLLIDDCASGGRRIDFETMRRSVPLWRSDLACSPISETAPNDVYNHNITLALGEYLPYHACSVWNPEANELRSAATCGLACQFDILNPDFDCAKAEAILIETVRLAPMWKGDFYPLTKPTLEETGFAAYQLTRDGAGYAAVFRLAQCPDCDMTLSLHAIDPGSDYLVTITDENMVTVSETCPGARLAEGFTVTLPAPHTSLILEYRKA